MMAILDRLDEAATSGLNLLSCERIVPIYADVVYHGTCNHSVSGLTWSFFGLLVVAFMGMLMITLRASFLNNAIHIEFDLADDDSELYVMRKATQRGAHEARAADYDAEVVDVDTSWQQQTTARQDTSDSGSVYTDGGELNVYAVERNGSLEITHSTSPKLYELEENSYDERGNATPSAPYEPGYGEYDYGASTNYKSRVY